VYKKEMDGAYHKFHCGVPFIPENSIGIIDIPTAEHIFKSARFVQYCAFLSDKPNKKL
jgi:hypothetical protein